jgi:ubiquitin C-terminal hydrolase
VPARKQMTLYDDPNVLVIHLKRFDGFHGGKISGHLDFDETLGASGGRGFAMGDGQLSKMLNA